MQGLESQGGGGGGENKTETRRLGRGRLTPYQEKREGKGQTGVRGTGKASRKGRVGELARAFSLDLKNAWKSGMKEGKLKPLYRWEIG